MLVLNVPKMNCEGCAGTIEKAVKALDAGAQVKADLAAKTVAVDTQVAPDRVSDAVRAAGYENSVRT